MNLIEALKSGKRFKRANNHCWMSEISNEENTCGCYFPILKGIDIRDGVRIAEEILPIIAEDIIAEDYEIEE